MNPSNFLCLLIKSIHRDLMTNIENKVKIHFTELTKLSAAKNKDK